MGCFYLILDVLFTYFFVQMGGSILIPGSIKYSMSIVTAYVQRILDAAGKIRRESVKRREGIWLKLQVKPRTTKSKH